MDLTAHQPSKIVTPSSAPPLRFPVAVSSASGQIIYHPPSVFQIAWAPAWFYSALNWLNASYLDARNVRQTFNNYLLGSDVDPYAELGSTKLFIITLYYDKFHLAISADVDAVAPQTTGTWFPKTDEGILNLYKTLSQSSVWPAVKYCFVPGRIGSDIISLDDSSSIDGLPPGYDPATGVRIVAQGSAVSQVVPVSDFTVTHNVQIYNASPLIVPVVTALVYDVTQHNELGDTTFTLPTYYTRDRLSASSYSVSKHGSTTTQGTSYGQTVVFPGGPGFSDASATALTVKSTFTYNYFDWTFTTYDFGSARVVTISTVAPKAEIGVMEFTVDTLSPQTVFAQQRIIGFYRDSAWSNCLGVPMYDYGIYNSSITAAALPLTSPITIYDPAAPFLNGGSLPDVLRKLRQATYLYRPVDLQGILKGAIMAQPGSKGARLSVTTCALSFQITSVPAVSVVDQLNVPITATVTTTPAAVFVIDHPLRTEGNWIGVDGNIPTIINRGPSTTQMNLAAFIPKEVLSGTGITTAEIGTGFLPKKLGNGDAFKSAPASIINLLDYNSDHQDLPAFDLAIAGIQMSFIGGQDYVVSLTGSVLTVRGSAGTSTPTTSGVVAPDTIHTYVGAMVYNSDLKTLRLYPKIPLALDCPTVGTHGVQQGEQYSVRLTYDSVNSAYDIIDPTQTTIATNVAASKLAPTDRSTPHNGNLYFGGFTGGSSRMTLWSIPVFLKISPTILSNASFSGNMLLEASASGTPTYHLQITDSTLFVYSNINIDNGTIGSPSSSNIYLASAVINSSPDDTTSKSFAPCRLLLGIIRQVQMGNFLKYVFVTEDDSVVIGGTRYMISVINLDAAGFDPNARPYPPVQWPTNRYWQFANRHNPYLDVRYDGKTQAARVAQAASDTIRISLEAEESQEPMQMFLDTDQMVVSPIYEFPYDTKTQLVDTGWFGLIEQEISNILDIQFPEKTSYVPGPFDSAKITVPDILNQNNPYLSNAATTVDNDTTASTTVPPAPVTSAIIGKPVENLNPNTIPTVSANFAAQQQLEVQKLSANISSSKNFMDVVNVSQTQTFEAFQNTSFMGGHRHHARIYGFTIFKQQTGEAYLVELVNADQAVPDEIPLITTNATYDPYYVRVVFLNTLTCYNMSIIVPSLVHDQYGNLAVKGQTYDNVLSKTDELDLGYLYSIYDANNNFDKVSFLPWPSRTNIFLPVDVSFDSGGASQNYVYTNYPYSGLQTALFNPISLYSGYKFANTFQRSKSAIGDALPISYHPIELDPAYFVCRRQNWNTESHLMQSTNPTGTSVYLAFGGGDLVPFGLDASFKVDKTAPEHLYKLTYKLGDVKYDAVKNFLVGNVPYVIGLKSSTLLPRWYSFSIDAQAGTADVTLTPKKRMTFPKECYIVGQASTSLTNIADVDAALKLLNPNSPTLADTSQFLDLGETGNVQIQNFEVVTYNNLVYLVRAVANNVGLGYVGGLGYTSGFLVDTFVVSSGNLVPAQAARHKRSGLSFFGSTYTPTTMVDTLDTLDFTSITGVTFAAPTIFIPVPELDAAKSFVADLSNFLGQRIWTFIYPEIVVLPNQTGNGIRYTNGFNLDGEGKPVLSLQKLQFVHDPLVVLFTPNDLAHKYPLQPKQQILALTNGQIREGICWRSANVQPHRLPPQNVRAQQILRKGRGMDRPNIIYSSQNRPVSTSTQNGYLGMSVKGIMGCSGTVYNVEESTLQNDQTATAFVSQVSSTANMLVGILFEYDNDNAGDAPGDSNKSTKGVVFLNGYLSTAGFAFSSPDHFDVNDVLKSQEPLLEQVAKALGQDFAFHNVDINLPAQFWTMTYDGFTAPGLPNYIANVSASLIDPTFTNRTRSLLLNLRNEVRPKQFGLIDTYNSVVSANMCLANGITGAIFLNKKAERDIASIGTGHPPPLPLYGLPSNYDFFVFSRNHYATLAGAHFDLIDQGYAMCLVDDGSGTGTKVASYFVDTSGNYYELYTYALYSPNGGILESGSFTLKISLGAPPNLAATPIIPETPNNVNPQDLAAQITSASTLTYAVFGPSIPGQAPAYIPIQAVVGPAEPQATPILGPPGFGGYAINVLGDSHQPVTISQIYSGSVAYAIAGSTNLVPLDSSGKPVPFYGSLSHGLDRQVQVANLLSRDQATSLPLIKGIAYNSLYGGNGQGSLIGTQYSCAFEGVGGIPPAVAGGQNHGGGVMKSDDSMFYTFNALTSTVMDSTGAAATVTGGFYFVDDNLDSADSIYGVLTMPSFTFNGNTYNVNISTVALDGVTSIYSLVIGGKSYPFNSDNKSVTTDGTTFTFNPIDGNAYTVTYAAVSAPGGKQAPSPITLMPFSIAAGGLVKIIDVFNSPTDLTGIVLGAIGRVYTYNPAHGTVSITSGGNSTVMRLQSGMTFTSSTGYGYVIGSVNGQYTINGGLMYPYSASLAGPPTSYPLTTSPQMFTIGGKFYSFDQDVDGGYKSVTGSGQTYPVNPYQFSLNGVVYILNTNVQPNTVIGEGNTYTTTAGNSQFIINGVQYTIALKQNSLNGAVISGQYNVTQGNVIAIEDYVYQLDTLNGQIVGNGTTYPLTTSGSTYTISSADRSFTVTTEPNGTTVTIDKIVYIINNTTVVGDGITFPVLPYRTFVDGASKFDIEMDGTVSVAPPILLSGSPPYNKAKFTDNGVFTVNDIAAFDGTNYHLMSGSPSQFTASGTTYTIRTDGVAIAAGAQITYLGNSTGPLSPNSFPFGSNTIYFGRNQDVAAFDGQNYFAIINGQFVDTKTGLTYTIDGNTAVNKGNSYEIFSNLGENAFFEVPNGPTYFVNMPVADTGSATGDVFSVFPISGGEFTMTIAYTIGVSGANVVVAAVTLPGGSTAVTSLTASFGVLTGGYLFDPVTKINYTCVVKGTKVTFVDSNNTVYNFSSPGKPNSFVASVVVDTGATLAYDSSTPPSVFSVKNNQFSTKSITFALNVPVAYQNQASGPYWPMINGRFTVPKPAPVSSISYTVKRGSVIKGYVTNEDDEFSVDGNVVYTINAVSVVRATNQVQLSGTAPNQILKAGSLVYTLDGTMALATRVQVGLSYNATTKQFTQTIGAVGVTYTLTGSSANDNRVPPNTFPATMTGTNVSFRDKISSITFKFNSSSNSPVSVGFDYTNQFFQDVLTATTYYVDVADSKVEAISYLPEVTQYAFTPANGNTYFIHYNDVRVVFPVISGSNVNAGVANIGADRISIIIDEVEPVDGGAAIPTNTNSFEINGNLYTITGTPNGADYSACKVVGDGGTPHGFLSAKTFALTDASVVYTLHLDLQNLPTTITATFKVEPSRNILSVNSNVYILTYNTNTTGSLLGQGQSSITIGNSVFTLTNSFDNKLSKFIFTDMDIYNSASVVGQFTVYPTPTFLIQSVVYTLDTVQRIVTDNNKRPFPLLTNPSMFSINGSNYVIDDNRTPHAIVGNDNVSPLSTDVTVQRGSPFPNSTFTLGGLIYKYTEDSLHNLLTITSVKSYLIAQPAMTFKLDSSLIFTLSTTPPSGSPPASIGTVKAGSLTLFIYAGVPESGGLDFFTYKGVTYTLVKSGSTYVAVQKSYPIYFSKPAMKQQQLATFNLNGMTYMVTDGSPAGPTSSGINPGNIWTNSPSPGISGQFGLVYGFTLQPIAVTKSANNDFQFQVTDAAGKTIAYIISYTAGFNGNTIQVEVPSRLPTFTQSFLFNLSSSVPLMFETGGYNAFTTFVDENSAPVYSYSAAYKTPVISSDPLVDTLIPPHGDFSLEFWHSVPSTTPHSYHPLTYSSQNSGKPHVYFIDIDFEGDTKIFIGINTSVLQIAVAGPSFSSNWRHFGLTFSQPYLMVCDGGGFEVPDGSRYDFNRDFSIAMTFGVTDNQTTQGLLYKGTGADNSGSAPAMSYRITVEQGDVVLYITNSLGGAINIVRSKGPAVDAGTTFQLIAVKATVLPTTNTGPNPSNNDSDPYVSPFDPAALGGAATGNPKFTQNTTDGVTTITPQAQHPTGADMSKFLTTVATNQRNSYTISMALRPVDANGSPGSWGTPTRDVFYAATDAEMEVLSTGNARLLIGTAFSDDATQHWPCQTGNVRELFLFNSAINWQGVQIGGVVKDIVDVSADDLNKVGVIGHWKAQYDANNIVNNTISSSDFAISLNSSQAYLAPTTGYELEATNVYINGVRVGAKLVSNPKRAAPSMTGYRGGPSFINFNAGIFKLSEISMWSMCRQPYQIVDDMFGRLVGSNEPFLSLYLSGSFHVPLISAPALPTSPHLPASQFIDNIPVINGGSIDVQFSLASLDLSGCPSVGRCGPLISPNLYTPPGQALTVCDSPPSLATYSTTLNSATGTLAGVINEAYVFLKDSVLTLFAGKKVGDLTLSWVTQEQGDVQVIGYIEGAPPCPMANLTNSASYAGATSMTLTTPTSATFKYASETDHTNEWKLELSTEDSIPKVQIHAMIAPFGLGADVILVDLSIKPQFGLTLSDNEGTGGTQTSSNKLDESNKYVVKMKGALSPYSGDQFMGSLNATTTASNTAGTPGTTSAILPNVALGGFTTSSTPTQLPKSPPTEEKFGSRMYVPSSDGQAFVTSHTVDVYQQTLVQSNTVYGFVKIPNMQIPRDLNVVSFRMSSKYVRPGCLDGVVGYGYNSSTLPNGRQTYSTSTGEMKPIYDKNFSEGEVGHEASYMKVVEAYKLKKEIDEQAYNSMALYRSSFDSESAGNDRNLIPGLDFYNENIWSSDGGSQEVKHTYTTTYDEVYNTSSVGTRIISGAFDMEMKDPITLHLKITGTNTVTNTTKFTYNTTGTASFDIASSFDGIESDTQMRYASANDAHFVMKHNSTFNTNNQSGLNLAIGSDGLVYKIVPSVDSGGGLTLSDNIDDTFTYTQPQPAYASGNANGLTGNLEPYDRPGKTKLFRTLSYFLQPSTQNGDNLWSTVVDPVWLKHSQDSDAVAMRSARDSGSIPWRILYRVTYSERFLPPTSSGSIVVPNITPLMAVPVTDSAQDFLFVPASGGSGSNSHNDTDANVVLVSPTTSGLSSGSKDASGNTVLSNNVIPFDLVANSTSIVNWGDSNNSKLLSKLISSALGFSTVQMSAQKVPGATKVRDIIDPLSGAPLYSTYLDLNGFTVNIAVNPAITVYQDVNSNPIQYFDGKSYQSLQADYLASPDGTLTYYIQPPAGYDQSTFDLLGDYDLLGHPGDEWHYFLVSGYSIDMTSDPTVDGSRPFFSSAGRSPYHGFSIPKAQHAASKTANQVSGYVLVKSILEWPHLNTDAETLADVLVYKTMSLLDMFPIGDAQVLKRFLQAQYPKAPFVTNAEICQVFTKNIVSYFNIAQQNLVGR